MGKLNKLQRSVGIGILSVLSAWWSGSVWASPIEGVPDSYTVTVPGYEPLTLVPADDFYQYYGGPGEPVWTNQPQLFSETPEPQNNALLAVYVPTRKVFEFVTEGALSRDLFVEWSLESWDGWAGSSVNDWSDHSLASLDPTTVTSSVPDPTGGGCLALLSVGGLLMRRRGKPPAMPLRG